MHHLSKGEFPANFLMSHIDSSWEIFPSLRSSTIDDSSTREIPIGNYLHRGYNKMVHDGVIAATLDMSMGNE